jgi:hypothetical protein
MVGIFFVISNFYNVCCSTTTSNAQTTTTATKTTHSNEFLTYENNSTLGVKIQYPANWQRDSYNNKVAFFAPSLGNSKIIPASMFVEVDILPFQITDVGRLPTMY